MNELALARNIVNQILDEAGTDVPTRQRINDACDKFVESFLVRVGRKAWLEGYGQRPLYDGQTNATNPPVPCPYEES